jgi:hypothetical protein
MLMTLGHTLWNGRLGTWRYSRQQAKQCPEQGGQLSTHRVFLISTLTYPPEPQEWRPSHAMRCAIFGPVHRQLRFRRLGIACQGQLLTDVTCHYAETSNGSACDSSHCMAISARRHFYLQPPRTEIRHTVFCRTRRTPTRRRVADIMVLARILGCCSPHVAYRLMLPAARSHLVLVQAAIGDYYGLVGLINLCVHSHK